MKEAIIYDMYQYLDVDASLYNYAEISVNGSYWGVYLALEAVEDSFMLRNYGTEDGELYKPDSMNMGGGKGDSISMPNMDFSDIGSENFDPTQFGNGDFDSSQIGNGDFDSSQMGNGNFDPSQMGNGNFDSSQMGNGNFDSSQMMPSDSDNSGGMQMPNMDNSNIPSDGMPGGNMQGGMMPSGGNMDNNASGNITDLPQSNGQTGDMGNMQIPSGGGGFSMSGSGADLNYIDDDLDSYSTIWDGEVTNTNDSDHKKVVEALKNISEGNDLETYMDVDNVLKYLAVHTFAVNLDSLSGSMAHNYYLYESDGQLNIIPWDYNLSFGAMNMGTSSGEASSVINFPIDTPFSSGISLSDREFFAALLENETYLEQYHAYYRILVEEYFEGGVFDETYNRIRSQIDALVETDPNALYTMEEYEAATQMLYDTISLRVESIKGQLDGSIPSTTEGQKNDSSSLIDASDIDISVMGTFTMNDDGNGGAMGGGLHFRGDAELEMPESSENIPDETMEENDSTIPEIPSKDDETIPDKSGTENDTNIPNKNGMTKPDNMNLTDITVGQDATGNSIQAIFWLVGCLIFLVILILFVGNYHRKKK